MRVWRAQLPNTRRGRSRVKPNIALLLTDDQDERSLGLVPGIEGARGAGGGAGRGGTRAPGGAPTNAALPPDGREGRWRGLVPGIGRAIGAAGGAGPGATFERAFVTT